MTYSHRKYQSIPVCIALVACALIFGRYAEQAVSQQTTQNQSTNDTSTSNTDSASAGNAISSIFDVMRAPPAKSMGLLQGNFLDAVKSDRTLQLALLIDTTESMTDQLAAIRENLPDMIDDLKKLTEGKIEIAIVTFSDAGNKSVGVTRLTQSFVTDTATIKDVISQLTAQSGAPYFPESVDLGIYYTLNDLPWADSDNVTRWIMLFGDAPPYESAFSDTETDAKRLYENEVLIDTANQKNINIHCLLCNSRDKEKQAFDAMIDNTRSFMSRISTQTGGLMLDMSYADVRKRLADSASKIQPETVRIGFITQEEIDAALASIQVSPASQERIKVAILPMMQLDQMSFFHERPEVQLATELRQLFKLVPQIRVVNPHQIETELTRIQSEGIPVDQWGQALCYRLRADVVLTGTLDISGDQSRVLLQPYAVNATQSLPKIQVNARSSELAKQMISQIGAVRTNSGEFAQLSAMLKNLIDEQKIDQSDIGILSNLDSENKSVLLAGFEALEQSLDYSLGDPNGSSLLNVAEDKLNTFLQANPKNPFVHALLASCQFNQAKAMESMGQLEEMKAKFKQSIDSIQQAYLLKDQMLDGIARLEIEGDYNLMVRQEFGQAIDKYKEILETTQSSPVNHALRAHWMMAGIYAGDWQAEKKDQSVVDMEKARQHLIQILAFWPDSVEAEKIKKCLHWDARKARSRVAYFPKESEILQ
jgi:hypothetical protein